MEKLKSTSVALAEEHLARYASSGMTQVAYCTEHGINKATFAYWLKRKRDSEKPEGFVQLHPKRQEGVMEVRFTNGVVVSFDRMIDAKYLKELIR